LVVHMRHIIHIKELASWDPGRILILQTVVAVVAANAVVQDRILEPGVVAVVMGRPVEMGHYWADLNMAEAEEYITMPASRMRI
ncbi:MAG TPA: hypothetical protein PKN52_03470, partial [Trueperaceae bacterium]|nr:hypothetical protein [Trueperaceae bacterium]